ncbi:MAG: peptidase U32 family protein [Oscillospiraceae bacterium]|jgi:putative protease
MTGEWKVPELLAPAGDESSLAAAIAYGADAVYLGAKAFGMRAKAANFEPEALQKAVQQCHGAGVKLYLTCNTLPRGREIDALPAFIRDAHHAGVDALIIADLGVMMLAKRVAPDLPIHVSTQFGVVNKLTARELYHMGASRVVLARELTLEEIAEIRADTPADLGLEAFVHGAMCVSVSGRCVLSNYMADRDANRGECAQPCRWSYALTESKRPDQHFPIYEEDGYSYILNSRDMRMIQHLDKLVAAGVDSLKIEGRAKKAYYVATITGAYRQALDLYQKDPQHFQLPDYLLEETEKISHRPYSTGFYLGDYPGQDTLEGGYRRHWELVATVDGWEEGMLLCTGRNRFSPGETLEILRPDGPPVSFQVTEIRDEEGALLEVACHPMMKLRLPCSIPCPPGSMLRRPCSQP